MGTLGRYLQDARNGRGIDLREAAQQTRISIQYLRALESEDFSKLPGEVFVRGFLKNYGKFLNLEESEVMKRYGELRQKPAAVAAAAPAAGEVQPEPAVAAPKKSQPVKIPVEPFIWAAGIIVVLIAFLFTAFPGRHPKETPQTATPSPAASDELASKSVPTIIKSDKLYLEVVALENTWLLVRTDSSPQKKAVLSQGESLIWSADERFLLSYGSAGAIKLRLNGQELTVNEPKNAVIRDLMITAAGIENRKVETETARPVKPKQPLAQQKQAPSAVLRQSMTSTAVKTAPTGTRAKKVASDQKAPESKTLHQSMTPTTEQTAPSGTEQRKSP